MLPQIRYPLPMMLALGLSGLLTWQSLRMTKAWRAEMADRVRRAVDGPPVPNSQRPQIFAGPIPRRALLLRDDTPASARPDGPVAETIDRRMFVDIYDTWPSPGPATHVRVGNRKAIGWVRAADLLEWDTRLVIRPQADRVGLGDSPEGPFHLADVAPAVWPVLAWTDKAVQVATWEPGRTWSAVARRAWIRKSDLPAESWGVWISQVELPILLGLANQGTDPIVARLRAVTGRLADGHRWSQDDLKAIREALPLIVLDRKSDPQGAAGRIAEANARAESDAGWSGLSFRFLPLNDLP